MKGMMRIPRHTVQRNMSFRHRTVLGGLNTVFYTLQRDEWQGGQPTIR